MRRGPDLGSELPQEGKNPGTRRNGFLGGGRGTLAAGGVAAAVCGRFTLTTSREVLARSFRLDAVPELAPRWNAAPGQGVATVGLAADGRRELRMRRWGLVPDFVSDPEIGSRLVNARAETAAVRPAFREALRLRRCLVPADGFYEWAGSKTRGGRQPYHIALPDRAPFAIAGLYEDWLGEQGVRFETCVLLTVAANDRVRALHDRMPAILAERDHDAWLDPALRDPGDLAPLLVPFAGDLVLRPVSLRVNRTENDDAECLAPPEQHGFDF
jgi:putative SOS response-associated peptidase YedK